MTSPEQPPSPHFGEMFEIKDDTPLRPESAARMRCDQPPLSETDLDDYCRGYFPPDTDHWGFWHL